LLVTISFLLHIVDSKFRSLTPSDRISQTVVIHNDFIQNSLISKALGNAPWIDILDKCTVNSPEQHELEQAAATGIGNARSLASIFSLLVNGRIVSDKTLTLLKKPFVNGTDLALKGDTIKGHGFFFYPPLGKFEKDLMMGHPGHGCQQVMFDMKNRIAFAYVTNGLKLGIYDLCRNYARLQKALYEVLDAQAVEPSQ
ncbi:hypothetical protein TELCIR_19322, partial [Teladorsagia circumcincta]